MDEPNFDQVFETLARVEQTLARVEKLVNTLTHEVAHLTHGAPLPAEKWSGENSSIGGRMKSLKDYNFVVPPNPPKKD
jgi:hypothetical protein